MKIKVNKKMDLAGSRAVQTEDDEDDAANIGSQKSRDGIEGAQFAQDQIVSKVTNKSA